MLEAATCHRQHAVVEQVIADLKNSPLAHTPTRRLALRTRLDRVVHHRLRPTDICEDLTTHPTPGADASTGVESRTTGGSTTLAQATTTTYPNRQHTHTGTVDLGSGTAYASWPKEQGEGFTGTVEHAALARSAATPTRSAMSYPRRSRSWTRSTWSRCAMRRCVYGWR